MLDGLRGIAALAVVAYHNPELMTPLRAENGASAVPLFFLMSGFVIEHAYRGRLSDGLSFVDFAKTRIIRLYPLYLLGTALSLLAAVAGLALGIPLVWTGHALLIAAPFALLMLPSPASPGKFGLYPLNVPAWSLFYEIVANLAYGAGGYCLSTRRLAIFVLIMAGARLGALANPMLIGPGPGLGWLDLAGGLLQVGLCFFEGVLLHRLHASGRLPRLQTPAIFPLTLALLLLFAPIAPGNPLWSTMMLFLLSPGLLLLSLDARPSHAARFCTIVGSASYALYILHYPICRILVRGGDLKLHGLLTRHAPYSGLVVLALLMALSVAVDRLYDLPIRRRLSRRFMWHRRAPQTRCRSDA